MHNKLCFKIVLYNFIKYKLYVNKTIIVYVKKKNKQEIISTNTYHFFRGDNKSIWIGFGFKPFNNWVEI